MKKPLSKTQSLAPGSKPGGKAQLTRTKSLAAGALGSSSHASPLVDPLLSESKPSPPTVLHSNDPQGAAGGCVVTVTTAQSFDAASELKRITYNDKLSNFRRDVEQAEAERLRARHEGGALPESRNLESLHLPTSAPGVSWSAVQHDGLRHLKPLRSTNSDPQDAHYETACGHLSLAKKLSDEGNKHEEKRRVQLGPTRSSPVVSPYTSPVRQRDETGGGANGHRKLERQLSLQGSEDPRLQVKVSRTGQKPRKGEGRGNKTTKFEFHGPALPVNPRTQQWYRPDNKVHITQLGTTFQFGDLSSVPPPHPSQHHHPLHAQHSHPIQQHHTMVAMNQHDIAAEHAAVTRHHSFGRESLIADHLRAGRMASAPGTFSYQTIGSNGNGGQGPRRRSSTIMPTIHRQNSTSDPQLHIHQDNVTGQYADLDRHAAMSMYGHHPPAPSAGRRGFGGSGGVETAESMMWASQCRSFEGPIGSGPSLKGTSSMFDAHLHLPGPSADERIPRGGSFDGHIPGHSGSFDNAIHPSGSFEDIGSGILHGMEKSRSFEGQLSTSDMGHQYLGGDPMPQYFHHQQQQQQQHQQQLQHQHQHQQHQENTYGSDQSLFMPGRMQMASPVESYHLPQSRMMAPRNSSPDIYLLPQPSPPQPQPPQQPTPQDIFSSQIGHRHANSISPVLVSEGTLQRLPTSAPSPPHPDDQPPPGPADIRQTLFYHLRGLFGDAKTREAMERLPNETDPGKLFAYISSQSTC